MGVSQQGHRYPGKDPRSSVRDDAVFWHENDTFTAVERAVRIHHRLVYIHPFRNGNGRQSRFVADLYLHSMPPIAATSTRSSRSHQADRLPWRLVDGDAMVTSRPSQMATGIVEWAERAPERAAFVAVQRTLTLAELDADADALAARLLDAQQSTGASPWLPVVVDRSLASTVALHGAIRAGCAFAPIESNLPPDVIADLFARLGHPNRAVVSQPEFAARLPLGVEVIPALGHTAAGSAAPQSVDPDAPGLVLFTSGTTGRAKGVVLPWSVLDQLAHPAIEIGADPSEATWREGLVQPFAFSGGFRGIALPSMGRTLCFADPTTMSIDDLLDWLDAQHIHSVSFPPSLSSALVKIADGRPRLPSVPVLRMGAEPSNWALIAPLRRLAGSHIKFRAGYAASEVGRIAGFDIGPGDPIGVGRIPLGRLEPGVRVRLAATDDDPSNTEILFANPRCHGYLGDAELTARQFVTDEEGVRWWKSGDLARVDDQGVYHHLGRADEMLKIHGIFVAPSRVEEALQTIDGIGAAAVVPNVGATGQIRLVAHVQVTDDALTPEVVHADLRQRLPRHLVPAIVVRHDALPRTERQKLDRRALESAPLTRWRSAPARDARGEVEQWCLSEVRRIAGLHDIGPDDDLFEAGLDSLSALELCAALADAGFGDPDPSQLLEAGTVAGICASLDRTAAPSSSTVSTVVALNSAGTQTPLFVVPGGGGSALTFRLLAESLGADRPVLIIEQRGMHRPGPPDRTIATLAAHAREEVEARLGPDDPCLILGYSASAPVAFEAAKSMNAAGRPVHLILLDSAPVRGSRESTDAMVRYPDDATGLTSVTVRTASPRELPGAVMRSFRYWMREARVVWLARRPGAPRYDGVRYRAFQRIEGAAWRAYDPDPAPVAFPATLIHVGDDDFVRRSEPFFPDLSVFVVGGNHHTMLQVPEVENLASVIASVTDAASLTWSAASRR